MSFIVWNLLHWFAIDIRGCWRALLNRLNFSEHPEPWWGLGGGRWGDNFCRRLRGRLVECIQHKILQPLGFASRVSTSQLASIPDLAVIDLPSLKPAGAGWGDNSALARGLVE
jgi:hypothetical protein